MTINVTHSRNPNDITRRIVGIPHAMTMGMNKIITVQVILLDDEGQDDRILGELQCGTESDALAAMFTLRSLTGYPMFQTRSVIHYGEVYDSLQNGS